MNKICTSIEQSKKLIELGIDVNTADMYYQWYSETNSALHVGKGSKKLNADCPAWSLAALLEILDYPQLSKDKLGSGKEGWMVSVYPNNCRYDSCWHDNPIDACYEMVLKLNKLKML